MDLSKPTLARMFPRAIPAWLDALAELGPDLCNRYQVTTQRRWAHFCGQVVAETAGLSIPHMRENMNYDANRLLEVFGPKRVSPAEAALIAHHPDEIAEHMYGRGTRVGGWLGNDQPGDGAKYIGRGIMQTTGKANYKKVGDEIGVDLVSNPGLLEQPEIGVRAAFADWNAMGVNPLADSDSVLAVTKRINGGTNGLPMRTAATARAKSIWGNGMVAETFPTPAVVPSAPETVPTGTTPAIPTPSLPPANDPVQPPPIIPPIPPPVVKPSDVIKGGSRTMWIIQWIKRLLGIGTGGGIAFMASSASDTKDFGHAVYSLLTDPVALMGLGGFVVAVGTALAAEHFILGAVRDGRIVPPGWLADTVSELGTWAGDLADQVVNDPGSASSG